MEYLSDIIIFPTVATNNHKLDTVLLIEPRHQTQQESQILSWLLGAYEEYEVVCNTVFPSDSLPFSV